MSFTYRKATAKDIPALLEIEKGATPSNLYLGDCREEFLDPARGELVVGVDETGTPRGFAHLALQYDGSAWLECLRVDPAWQKKGCGAVMWERFVSYCKETGCSHLGMFTGLTNYPSKVLAERNGLHVDYINREGNLPRESAPQVTAPEGFTRITDPAQIEKAMLPYQAGYEGYFCMNRTYFRCSGALYEGLAKDQEVYVKGDTVVILGARFLKDRALHIGYMGGDVDACIDLAIARLQELGLPKLTCVIPSAREDLREALEKKGFAFPQSQIIVLEREF